MNAPLRPHGLVTRQRHLFTADDVLALIAKGLVDKRTVLLDGEIFNVPDAGDRHINHAKQIAQRAMVTLVGKPYFVGVQTTLRLSKHNAPSPEIYILAGALPKGGVPSAAILLVIEVADTSLKDDLTDSASRYARHGVREFWVVDVENQMIHVHRDPIEGAYPAPTLIAADMTAAAAHEPGFRVRLADLLD